MVRRYDPLSLGHHALQRRFLRGTGRCHGGGGMVGFSIGSETFGSLLGPSAA